MNRLLLLFLLLHTVFAIESCVIQQQKVRRFNLILPIGRVVRTIVSHRDYVLISLGPSVVGKTGHPGDPAGRLHRGVRECFPRNCALSTTTSRIFNSTFSIGHLNLRRSSERNVSLRFRTRFYDNTNGDTFVFSVRANRRSWPCIYPTEEEGKSVNRREALSARGTRIAVLE